MSRRRKIDLQMVEEMAAEFCTQEEISRDMDFDRVYFYRRKDVQEAFEKGKNTAKMSLRHMMYRAAQGGDKTMMIFLAKNELGYKDAPKDDPKLADTEDLSPLVKLLEVDKA